MEDKILVRVYELVDDGNWKDKGTGTLYVVDDECLLVVSNEETEAEIISHTIRQEIEYELQGETIITWIEKTSSQGSDLALSFQENEACLTVWMWINQILQHLISTSKAEEPPAQAQAQPVQPINLGMDFDNWVMQNLPVNSAGATIPMPTPNNLETIITRLQNSPGRDSVSLQIHQEAWFLKLYDILKQGEDFDNWKICTDVWRILKELSKRGDKLMIDRLSSKEHIHKTIHIAEYHENRKCKNIQPTWLRDTLKKSMKLKLPGVQMPEKLSEDAVRLYELIYLRSVCLLTCIEEQALAIFNHHIYHANLMVLNQVTSDSDLLGNVCTRIKHLIVSELQPDKEDLVVLVSFLREICMKAKDVQYTKRAEIFRAMVSRGVLDTLYRCIKSQRITPQTRPLLWTRVVEALTQIIYGSGTTILKGFCLAQQTSMERPTLWGRLVETLGQFCNEGLQLQISYLIRTMLIFQDPTAPEVMQYWTGAPEVIVRYQWKIFQENHLEDLINILKFDPSPEFPQPCLRLAQHQVINILLRCINRHHFNMQSSTLFQPALNHAVRLIQIPTQPNFPIPNVQLVLSILRFLRAAFKEPGDDHYLKSLIKDNLLDNCVKIFVYNGRKQNLLNSTFLSLYAELHAAVANMKPTQTNATPGKDLTMYFGNRYLDDLMKVDSTLFEPLQKRMNGFDADDMDPALQQNELNTLPSDDEREPEQADSAPILFEKDISSFLEMTMVRRDDDVEEDPISGLLSRKPFENKMIKLRVGTNKPPSQGLKRTLENPLLPDAKKTKT